MQRKTSFKKPTVVFCRAEVFYSWWRTWNAVSSLLLLWCTRAASQCAPKDPMGGGRHLLVQVVQRCVVHSSSSYVFLPANRFEMMSFPPWSNLGWGGHKLLDELILYYLFIYIMAKADATSPRQMGWVDWPLTFVLFERPFIWSSVVFSTFCSPPIILWLHSNSLLLPFICEIAKVQGLNQSETLM